MAQIELKAEMREAGTKKALADMRKVRKIPGTVYGGKGKAFSIAIGEKELMSALKQGGTNVILRLKHDKGEDTVIVKEIQRHVVTSQPIHADFQRISLTEKITVKVPLHAVGEAPGVKLQGGVLEHVLREIEVRCLPNAIPQKIDLDVSKMDVGGEILVSQLPALPEVEYLQDPAQIVLHIIHVVVEKEAEPAADAAAGEPEVIAKGKKEEGEEGEGAKEGAKDAKAPAGKGAPAAKAEGGKKEEKK
ncbi:MAG: 50S ribosomal protein L25 [Elusimicrobiota bacterium]